MEPTVVLVAAILLGSYGSCEDTATLDPRATKEYPKESPSELLYVCHYCTFMMQADYTDYGDYGIDYDRCFLFCLGYLTAHENSEVPTTQHYLSPTPTFQSISCSLHCLVYDRTCYC